ncbi:MAG: flagellar biosynthetic protein FliR [Deltaproteobacteria bacterium]|nr:flagellar biosynthetic protein FliR [Deltaproteobacteria bacterium]
MTTDAQTAFFSLVPLLAIRIGAALRLAPFFGGKPLPLLPWAALSIVLAWVIAPQSGPLPTAVLGGGPWLALAAKELFIGIVIGALARIAFSVLEIAGDLARLSTTAIPATGDDTDTRGFPLTKVYTLLGTAAFLLMDGHHAFITGLAGTTRCLPPASFPGAKDLVATGASPVLELFSTAMGTAVLISAPVFVAGLAADFLVGLISRLVPGVAPPAGAQAARAVAVQLAVIAALGFVVSAALKFLQTGMEGLSLC